MKDKREYIQRVPEYYVYENFVQLCFSFRKNISLFCVDDINNGLICHYDFNNDDENINLYLNDKNRNKFPYSNIPMYRGKNGKYYVNQILEFNKHYILIIDGEVRNIYAVNNDKETFVLNREIYISNFTRYKWTNINDIFDSLLIFAFDFSGNMYTTYYSSDIKKIVKNGGGLFVFNNNYRHDNKIVVKYVIMKKYFDEIKMCYSDKYYDTKIYSVPFNNYSFEELKFLSTKFKDIKEPRINLSLNPNVEKKEIEEAKKKIKILKHSK